MTLRMLFGPSVSQHERHANQSWLRSLRMTAGTMITCSMMPAACARFHRTLASSGSNASVPPSSASFYVPRNEASIPAATVMASNVVEKAQTDGVCVSANRKTEKIGKREGQGEKK